MRTIYLNEGDLQSLCFLLVWWVGCLFFFVSAGATKSSTVILLKSTLDTKVRQGSHSYEKSQVCNFIFQLVQSCQLKLFMLTDSVLFMINITIRIC